MYHLKHHFNEKISPLQLENQGNSHHPSSSKVQGQASGSFGSPMTEMQGHVGP